MGRLWKLADKNRDIRVCFLSLDHGLTYIGVWNRNCDARGFAKTMIGEKRGHKRFVEMNGPRGLDCVSVSSEQFVLVESLGKCG